MAIAGALLGGLSLLGFLARSHWRLEQACHFRVQYFWGLALVAIVLVTLKHRRLGAIAGSLAAVNLAVILPLYSGPAPAPLATDQPTTRTFSLNVRWNNRQYARTLELIAKENPDILAFFEVTQDWVDALAVLETSHPHFRHLPHRDQGGIALYSRLPIENLRVELDPEIRLPTIVAEVVLPSGKLTLLTTHPPSPVSPHNFDFRNRQLEEVGRWAAQPGGAVMVLGDLNTTSWSPYFRDLLTAGRLRDSRRGFGVEPSWPNMPAVLRIPIDHCLVSSSVDIHDRRIGAAVGSDHRPVIVDFAIRRNESGEKAVRDVP